MAFTEQGVAMLSSVLNSEKAIQVNIEILLPSALCSGGIRMIVAISNPEHRAN